MNNRVYLLLAFGLIGVSFGAPLARYVPELAALTIAFWRMAGASGVLWSHSIMLRQGPLGKTRFPAIIIAGIFLGLHFACFYSAVKLTPIANATLFATLAPIFTLAYERMVLKQSLKLGALVGLSLAVLGGVIIQGGGIHLNPDETRGNLMALASSGFMSVVLLIGQRVRVNITNIMYTRWMYLFAALTLLAIALVSGIDISFRVPDMKWLALLVILPTLIGHNSMNYAVKYLRPTIVGSMPFGEPVLASILAWMMFGETPTAFTALGGTIVLIGLLLITRNRN